MINAEMQVVLNTLTEQYFQDGFEKWQKTMVSDRFAALEGLHAEVKINSPWETEGISIFEPKRA
jgi:hypothetical protein